MSKFLPTLYLIGVFLVGVAVTGEPGLALVAMCVALVFLPPAFDPAIQIKETMIRAGIRPESN